jgi:hypothetical protein
VKQLITDGDELFLIQNYSKEELANYDLGFQKGLAGEDFDDSQSHSWQRGWAAAQE